MEVTRVTPRGISEPGAVTVVRQWSSGRVADAARRRQPGDGNGVSGPGRFGSRWLACGTRAADPLRHDGTVGETAGGGAVAGTTPTRSGGTRGPTNRPGRTRRPGRGNGHPYVPALVLVAGFLVAGVVAWTVVFVNSTAGSVTSCNPSPVPGSGTSLASTALDQQPAAAPGDVRVTVLNGAGQRGQAQLAAVELGELGIGEAAPPDNDRLHPAQDLTCVGQIRYGPQGAAAARTLSLVAPCAELVRDNRADPSVDLALGSDFRDISPGQPVTETLRALSRQTAGDQPGAGPDPAALNTLRAVNCGT